MNVFSHCCRCALAGRANLCKSGYILARHMSTPSISTHVGRPGTILGRVHYQERGVMGRLAPAPLTSGIASSWLHTSSSRSTMLEDIQTKTLMVWNDAKEMSSSPLPALTMGLAGLVPFVAVPVIMMGANLYMPSLAFAQVAYGAAVLSFNGGIRMGLALPDDAVVELNYFNLGYGAASTVVATLGLLLPNPLSAFTIIGGLGVVAYFDMAMCGYPVWYKGMRIVTAFVAILSLWTTLMCGLMLRRTRAKPVETPSNVPCCDD